MIRAAVARGWGSAIAKVCDKPFPDCSRCRRPGSELLRKSWGCDDPADHVVWESSCPRCSGTLPDCGRCGGTGEVSYDRCPSAVIDKSGRGLQMTLDLLLRAYSHYDRRNVMPMSGGWLDQSRSFLCGVDLIDSERAWWDEIHREHTDREATRAKLASQQKTRQPRRR